MFLGLRTVIYPAPDLAAAKVWYAKVLGAAPYFDEPFYVWFSVGGFELGGGIKVAAVPDPFGNRLGIIENPSFDPGAPR
jgi:catechol 2,3-dioxygenase-like lactoylglutathione lyase family enzyme